MKLSQTIAQRVRSQEQAGETANHRLLVQAGFVDQLMAGVFTYLPLGLRVLERIEAIVRKEMNTLGASEIHMPALHPSANWKITGAWDSVDVLFKLQSRTGKEYALGQSHEEIVAPLLKDYIATSKDLPLAVYQVQWKFRDELRAKSGLLRGREFLMKDMYSVHATQEDFDQWYIQVKEAYIRIFSKFGLNAKVTEASGGSFSQKISYEFMVLTDAGEDTILYCTSCSYCINIEISKERTHCPHCKSRLVGGTASEVGNVFDLGQRYTRAFDISFTDDTGRKEFPVMGCFGIGISRLMGVIVEKAHDHQGIIWPKSVAPFQASLVSLNGCEKEAEKIYRRCQEEGIDVIWDDRDISAGKKFFDADLMGNPYRIVLSKKSIELGGVEIKKRTETDTRIISIDEMMAVLSDTKD